MYEILADFNLVVVKVDRQTTKFNSPPNFPAIWHTVLVATLCQLVDMIIASYYHINHITLKPYNLCTSICEITLPLP